MVRRQAQRGPAQHVASFMGFFDRFEDGVAYGWVYSALAPLNPVIVHVVVDGQEIGRVAANGPREDILAALRHPTGDVGFTYAIPPHYQDGREHRISFRLPGGFVVGRLDPADLGNPKPDLAFALTVRPQVGGFVDGLRQGQLRGWATRTEPGETRPKGGCHVRVTCNGVLVAEARAGLYRADVAAHTGADPYCGFQITLPPSYRSRTPHRYRFEVMPDGIELPGSPVTVSLLADEVEGNLMDVVSQIDGLFRNYLHLRRTIENLVPQSAYTLADYHHWASLYFPALRGRMQAERAARANAGMLLPDPLVSIVLPLDGAALAQVEAAVGSVRAQTYEAWELVIAGGSGKDRTLATALQALCKQDGRIRLAESASRACEPVDGAIAACRGEWIAFLPPDATLVDVALEALVRAAQESSAILLYADEDQAAQGGGVRHPSFKPDWNYRYLLGRNYVGRFLFVQRVAAGQAGPATGADAAARAYDRVLRLVEIVPAEAIHHVPEVLFHERAIAAGPGARQAVADHLGRRGVPAKVGVLPGEGFVDVAWQFSETPKICIVIPFKEQVDATRHCLNTVLSGTAYANFEVLLLDNWSVSAAAAAFVAQASKDDRVQVLRVEEPFNFARLNNLAAARTQAPYLLFMNNDLVPKRPDWLRVLVDETLADPSVAVVAGRYLYPDGMVQHAGVVVGPQGCATHLHRGLPGGLPGYEGRLALSQEMTAVTAACMLVRADVFRQAGGFDEAVFRVAYNDVDLCLRIRSAGHKVVYCARMEATHDESLSRGSDDRPEHEARFFQEQQALVGRWKDETLFRSDPAYNPHFTVNLRSLHDLARPD